MSDVMLLGVLRMPIDYKGGPWSPMAQLVARAREAADLIEQQAKALAEAELIMGYDDAEKGWRNKWAHLWATGPKT